jgi:hypothetical protein
MAGILKNNALRLSGRNLSDDVIHGVPALGDIYGGTYHFDANGTLDRFHGKITFTNALWAKSAVYNNVLASLNAIPSLFTGSRPGFNQYGFKIKKGVIRYTFENPVFIFDQVSLQGDSANIYGSGLVNFDTRQLDVDLNVQFMRDFSEGLKKVPALGYVLLGQDGSIAVGLKVRGTLENPKVTTNAPKEILTAPLNILQRTITLPFKIFE